MQMDMKVSRMVTIKVTILRPAARARRARLVPARPFGKGVGDFPVIIVFVVRGGFEPARVQSNAPFVVVVVMVVLVDIVQFVLIGESHPDIPVVVVVTGPDLQDGLLRKLVWRLVAPTRHRFNMAFG